LTPTDIRSRSSIKASDGTAHRQSRSRLQPGLPVWYFVAKDEGHVFSKKSNYDYHFYATVMLVKRVVVELIGDFVCD
jgi:hypothetical protein